MEGTAFTNECFMDNHDECKDDIRGYQGIHVPCDCKCHKDSQKKHGV